ncbi:sorbitol dehydrogenase-like [Trifolium pratense]|uniref:sorbitol dehydrogenase-like n=1 Tax=Trifolium pratense TaxID=57577 RepID=UPI001E693ABA|nr:sorbitol dehydrogenase-like [Trifolium pratense]
MHDVRIRMIAVGICGSDIQYLKVDIVTVTSDFNIRQKNINPISVSNIIYFMVKEPMAIGHECAGIIEEVGSQVQTLVPGDRVAVEPGINCWPCEHCKLSRYNLCPEMMVFATPPVYGSLANQKNVTGAGAIVVVIWLWTQFC